MLTFCSEDGTDAIEWDIFDNRVDRRNLAQAFGWTTCEHTNMAPCKLTPQSESYVQKVGIDGRGSMAQRFKGEPFEGNSNDYYCDISPNLKEAKIAAMTVGSLANAMNLLSSSQLLYNEEGALINDVKQDIADAG